jgi:uncharacterized protein (DUF934 family)
MSVIVTDTGFHADTWARGFASAQQVVAASAAGAALPGVDMGWSDDPSVLLPCLDAIALIRVRFPHYNEVRGFDLAQALRAQGYRGRLRAQGHVLAHQYTLARRSGFDEVEIGVELARRQPEEHWRFRGNWRHAEFHSMMTAASMPRLADSPVADPAAALRPETEPA